MKEGRLEFVKIGLSQFEFIQRGIQVTPYENYRTTTVNLPDGGHLIQHYEGEREIAALIKNGGSYYVKCYFVK